MNEKNEGPGKHYDNKQCSYTSFLKESIKFDERKKKNTSI
jgi:hypothetical protein